MNNEDKHLKKLLTKGLYKEAPKGITDRIIRQIQVSSSKKTLSTKPVEPSNFMATILVVLSAICMLVAYYFKPSSFIPHSLVNFNPVWVAPIVACTLLVWVYILLSKHRLFKM